MVKKKKKIVNKLTNKSGLDGVIICASSKDNNLINSTIKYLRKKSRVVVVGDTPINADRNLIYEKEIDLKISRSYGPGRYDENYEVKGNDYPVGYVRWTEQRNFEAVLSMMSKGLINIKPLITESFNFVDAKEAYKKLDNPNTLGLVLKY